jgi:hypothetical protein
MAKYTDQIVVVRYPGTLHAVELNRAQVTGASGFIGSHIAFKLLESGFTVRL